MASRRTRAASKVSSAREASPDILELDIPRTGSPLRRSPRKGGSAFSAAPLPSVGLGTSTAYGTNTHVQPNTVRGPENQGQINNVLSDILEPTRGGRPGSPSSIRGLSHRGGKGGGRGGRRGGSLASASSIQQAEETFGAESSFFGDVPSFEANSTLGVIPELPAPKPPVFESPALKNQRPVVIEVARKTRVGGGWPPVSKPAAATAAAVTADAPSPFSLFISQFGQTCSVTISLIVSWMNWLWDAVKTTQGISIIATLFVATIVLLIPISLSIPSLGVPSLSIPQNPIRWSGIADKSHSLGQFISHGVAYPFSAFVDDEAQDLTKRFTAAKLDDQTISHLEEVLPGVIVCKQDEQGNLQIPGNFWHAIRDKISSDKTLFETIIAEAETTASPSGGGLSKKQVLSIAHKEAEKVIDNSNTKNWETFLNNNRARIISWSSDEFDKQTQSLRGEVLASKSDFIALVEQNWADTQDAIRTELRPYNDALKSFRTQLKKLEKNSDNVTPERVRAIATEVSQRIMSATQLDALANANSKSMTQQASRRVNHFSPGTGAVIHPMSTSPNFIFPNMKRGMMKKALSSLFFRPVPSPNPPKSALSRWEEHGDCWCSALDSFDGFGATLGVVMANNIYPDQITVEHIPASASLEPGAAPKDMELFASIDDPVARAEIEKRSELHFGEGTGLFGLVRIAKWTYDSTSPHHIQTFPVQIDLKTFDGGSYTSNLMVRVKTGWGGDALKYTCLYRVRVNGDILP